MKLGSLQSAMNSSVHQSSSYQGFTVAVRERDGAQIEEAPRRTTPFGNKSCGSSWSFLYLSSLQGALLWKFSGHGQLEADSELEQLEQFLFGLGMVRDHIGRTGRPC